MNQTKENLKKELIQLKNSIELTKIKVDSFNVELEKIFKEILPYNNTKLCDEFKPIEEDVKNHRQNYFELRKSIPNLKKLNTGTIGSTNTNEKINNLKNPSIVEVISCANFELTQLKTKIEEYLTQEQSKEQNLIKKKSSILNFFKKF